MAKSPAHLQLDIESYLAGATERFRAKEQADKEQASKDALQAKIDAYAEKQERKRDRLERAAGRARAESSARLATAHRIGDAIPFGQPILVGHHSERRHRSDIEKIDRNMRKGFEASDRANELAARAAAIGTGGISSDDPEAVQKLKRELAPLVDAQEKMKAANAAIRKHAKAGASAQVAALLALGYPQKVAEKLLEKDFAGRIGFADYQIKNNGANIRRIEARIEELAKKETTPARADVTGTLDDGSGLSFTLRENKDQNRTQIEFSGKPSDAMRAKLKSAGFRWAPTDGVWQRQLSNGAWYHATQALGLPL